MIRRPTATAFKIGAVAFLLVVSLFTEGVLRSSSGFIGSILREITAVFWDPETQWMVFLCLGVYFLSFLFFRSSAASGFWRAYNSNLWLVCMLLINALLYAIDYSPSAQTLTLLGGAMLGQGAAVWAWFEVRNQKSEVKNSCEVLILSLLVILLVLASAWQADTGHNFEYHGHMRWSGPWDNPNIFGLLMGMGIALAFGLAVASAGWRMTRESKIRKYTIVILCFVSAMLMVRGLLHSYSRGAWLATLCGLALLVFQTVKDSHFQQIRTVRWIRTNKVSLVVIMCSIAVLAFWQFQQPQHPVARRASSVGNVNDFSWRNRIVAWEGSLQMMADKPWFGFGWNQPEPLYEHYYLPPKSTESVAIQMNDYLLLGATLGIPALFCFGMCIWLSLRQHPASSIQPPELLQADWMQTICRAGAIVLLVGFWFDGGLFRLATASTFWILLELGRRDLTMAGTK